MSRSTESAIGASRSSRNAVTSAGTPPASVRSTMRAWKGTPRRRATGRLRIGGRCPVASVTARQHRPSSLHQRNRLGQFDLHRRTDLVLYLVIARHFRSGQYFPELRDVRLLEVQLGALDRERLVQELLRLVVGHRFLVVQLGVVGDQGPDPAVEGGQLLLVRVV